MKYDIAIDLGSSNTVILKNEVGVVLVEPTLLLINHEKKDSIVAFGEEAKREYPACRETCQLVSPVREGVLVSKDLAKSLLRYFLEKVDVKSYFKGNLLLILPGSISKTDKNEFVNLAYSLGFKNVEVLPSAIAGLQQLEVEYNNPLAHMLVDIGGGKTDVAVVYKGKIIQGCTIDVGGEMVDRYIKHHLASAFNTHITISHGEEIKKALASILPNDLIAYNICGTYVEENSTSEIALTAQEIRDIYVEFYEKICNAINAVLSMCNSQITRDITKTGIYLCGGMANIVGLEKFMKTRLGVNVYIDEQPENTVILGVEKLFNEPTKLKYLIGLNN